MTLDWMNDPYSELRAGEVFYTVGRAPGRGIQGDEYVPPDIQRHRAPDTMSYTGGAVVLVCMGLLGFAVGIFVTVMVGTLL